ncbi:ABC transporter permease [Candidatus Enterococcus ferrettii]|uniref:ABC3 transporter permease C-terminal domain-containing protein n=1 Tax=Candidatus Enterococcus ferrettii TaxID=2815324 RepID=A0ABV0EW18_9ENTE|nr:FtsX-like permease family protein [Enterococcus sp. 665A]MBO1342628.1 FtsX-like permease family protein [Enterococcus sp. 665A]
MFYIKLALNNLRKNHRAYLPFLISMIFLVAVTTMTQVIVNNPGMEKLPDSYSAMIMFRLGNIILMIFSVIFSIYTNSFLLKQRKKEIGLYNVLGLGKRELYCLMFWENLLSFVIVLISGIISGIIFGKLGFLILKKMLGVGEAFVFQLTFDGLTITVGLFVLIFLFLFLINCLQIRRTNPIDLLHSSKSGEKEPKSRWFLSILGLICLFTGYAIALLIESPVDALIYFFIAVILVIVGTYSLFISGSITLLKSLKKRKNYYYKPNHFISVSNMIYRMKQNAAGLASICILSTMVLVTMATTGSLFFGGKDMVESRYTHDISVSASVPTDQMEQTAKDLAKEQGLTLKNFQVLQMSDSVAFMREGKGNQFDLKMNLTVDDMTKAAIISFVTLQEYNRLSNGNVQLAENELVVFAESGDIIGNRLSLEGEDFKIKKVIDEFIGIRKQNNLSDVFLIVLKDQAKMDQLIDRLAVASGDEHLRIPTYSLSFDIAASESKRLDFAATLAKKYSQQFDTESYQLSSKDEYALSNKTFSSGFFFLGMIFGVTFTLATALIIYYKQISEGMDDQLRFEILQKVGMSHIDVKKVIQSQVLAVFLFPLVVAVIHLAFAFPIIQKLLILFGLMNWHIFLIVTIAVVLIFAILYFIVYQLTARSYYQIVERET